MATTAPDIDALWVGESFRPVFERKLHPLLALLFAFIGLVYAGRFIVTRKSISKEVVYALVSAVSLGLATVLGFQAFGLYV